MSLNLGILASSKSAASGGTLLLDTYSGAAAAYSLRKLRTAYTGSAIRVRRSSDNTQIDIGFVNGELDTITLLSFAGPNTCYVTIWYDQSGNSRNLIQTNNSYQTRIVNQGVIVYLNGKPVIDTNVGYFTTTQNGFITLQTHSDFFIIKGLNFSPQYAGIVTMAPLTGNDYDSTSALSINVNNLIGTNALVQSNSYNISGTGLNSAHRLISHLINASSGQMWQNNVSAGTSTGTFTTNNTGPLVVGTRYLSGSPSVSYFFNGYMQEIIIYNINQLSNRLNIQTNINSYYTIY